MNVCLDMFWTFCAAVLERFSIAAATVPALVLYSFPSALSRYQVKVTMATVLSPHLLSVSVATVLKISGMLESNRNAGSFKLRGFLSSLTRYLLGCFTWELSALEFFRGHFLLGALVSCFRLLQWTRALLSSSVLCLLGLLQLWIFSALLTAFCSLRVACSGGCDTGGALCLQRQSGRRQTSAAVGQSC